jgi:hypothetical protein
LHQVFGGRPIASETQRDSEQAPRMWERDSLEIVLAR